jgi:polar amino acid transport system permease protein
VTLSAPDVSRRQVGHDKVLELTAIQKRFGAKEVLKSMSLTVRAGEVVSIIGPSGSGKTTLIRTINALQDIDAGQIRFQGKYWISNTGRYHMARDFHEEVTHLGMVFQSFNLFPHLTVLDNVMLGPRHHGMGSKAEISDQALAQLAKVGMAVHADKYPHQLSGGQKQRAAIARALAMKPKVMLFDEPTSALDPELVGEVLAVIERLAAEGMTMVIVTHEMRFATRVSDRIVMMEDGALVANVTKEELAAAPEDARIRRFMAQADAH